MEKAILLKIYSFFLRLDNLTSEYQTSKVLDSLEELENFFGGLNDPSS